MNADPATPFVGIYLCNVDDAEVNVTVTKRNALVVFLGGRGIKLEVPRA